MSCLVLDPKSINNILSNIDVKCCHFKSRIKEAFENDPRATGQNFLPSGPDLLTLIGRALTAENLRSYNFQYEGKTKLTLVDGSLVAQFSFKKVDCTFGQSIMSLHCLNYNSCECKDYENTTAKKLIDALERSLIENMPDYKSAKWG